MRTLLACLLLAATSAFGYLPPKDVRFELVEFSADGRTLQGGLFAPAAGRASNDIGVVLVHGVESYWYQGPPMFLGGGLAHRGYAALAYNGAHSGESFRTSEFETAVKEVGAAVTYMKGRGYRTIVVMGHSLGTPIVQHYQGSESKAAVEGAIRRIRVPMLIVYDPADNIQGKGGLTKRETLAGQIKASAIASPRADVLVIPSRPGSSPLQAHNFVGNEDLVAEKTAQWLKSLAQ